jgi:hypothetical protein
MAECLTFITIVPQTMRPIDWGTGFYCVRCKRLTRILIGMATPDSTDKKSAFLLLFTLDDGKQDPDRET